MANTLHEVKDRFLNSKISEVKMCNLYLWKLIAPLVQFAEILTKTVDIVEFQFRACSHAQIWIEPTKIWPSGMRELQFLHPTN